MRALLCLVVAGCYTGATAPSPAITIGEPHHDPGLVFVSGREAQDHWSSPQIFLAKPSAQHATNLTNNARSNFSPAISPDGTHMVFVSDRTLRVMRLSDGDEHTLDLGDGPFASVRWAGRQLAFVSPPNTQGSSIWIVPATGGDPARVTDPGSGASDELLTFVDHGRRIVFARYDQATRDRDLWITNIDGSNLRRITDTKDTAETEPTTSHDGRYIAYRAYHTPHDSLRIMTLADGTVRDIALPDEMYNVNGLDFAADDQSIIFGADAPDVGGSLENIKGELFSIALDGTNLQRLTKNAAYDGQPAVIP